MMNLLVIDRCYKNCHKSYKCDLHYPGKYLMDMWLSIELVQLQFEERSHLGSSYKMRKFLGNCNWCKRNHTFDKCWWWYPDKCERDRWLNIEQVQ